MGETELLETELLRRFRSRCGDGELLIGSSISQYAAGLRSALGRLGLGLFGITPNSARAGFATDAVVSRMSFSVLKLAGRWASDSFF